MTRQEALDVNPYSSRLPKYGTSAINMKFINPVALQKLINSIYDGIGICRECRYYKEESEDTDNVCTIQGILHPQDWYCADFETKERDT